MSEFLDGKLKLFPPEILFHTNHDFMRLGKITIFPIKSLDGISVAEATITAGGILQGDRVYAIFDEQGGVVNGKRTPRVHELRCAFDDGIREVRLWEDGGGRPEQFSFEAPAALNRWLSAFFGFAVELRHEPKAGFPDDLTAFGPTVVSEASVQSVGRWYPGLDLENVRRRFRTNLEVLDGPAFCEDALFGEADELKRFHIGSVAFLGHNPCQRCAVPTRDPASGQGTAGFQKQFMEWRRQEIPPWANQQRFNHYYRFAVNTSIPADQAGKCLRIGDEVVI
ncbi:MAG: MOSC N-terminal beta barrel domain-containing protein [Chthoniobacter sp.]|uniref:MOSC domain-containing protein n=1 Tax=Chthoniobacter sp. TaxID=2510640 RepID=UPI0032A81EA8